MNVRKDIKSLLAKENIMMREVAEKLGTAPNNLSNKLRNDTIKFREVREIADILGYDIKFEKRQKKCAKRVSQALYKYD